MNLLIILTIAIPFELLILFSLWIFKETVMDVGII